MKKGNRKYIIMYAVMAAAVALSYFAGYNVHYDESYMEEKFNTSQDEFSEITTAQNEYELALEEKESIQKSVDELNEKIQLIEVFESKQNEYTAEIADLENQVNGLNAQKTEKEAALNKIDSELAEY